MSDRLAQILAEYEQATCAAQSATDAKKRELIEANPDLADELLKYFDSAGEPSIAETVDFGKPQYDTVTHVPRAEFDTVAPAPRKGSQSASTASNALSRFGDYELIQEIARGGMGVVHKARQKKADRIVALKMILSGQLAGDDEVSRFHAEAKAAAKLDHPGIVPVYDVGEIDGQHYFSMGYVEGGNLSGKLRNGPLPPRLAVEYMKSIAEAMAFAHEHGVIHRDLKPSNILVGSDGQPRVTDFGLAKQLDVKSDLTASGYAMGTPSYMPPEQAHGKLDEIGTTSDVYSLGAVFYCLLTGRPPFQAASPVEILRQVVDQEPASLRLLNRSIPKDLETICLKCLRKESTQRYASSQDLADDLKRWLNNEPIKARPVGRLEKSWLWCKRRPTLVATVATAALLLVAVSWYLIIRGSDAEATRLVDGLLGAETSNVDGIIKDLSGYREWADDDLAAAYEDPPAELPNAKLHASLAMVHNGDTSVLETLREDLLIVSPSQFRYVRDLMIDHQDALIDDYWKIVKDDGDKQKAAVARRFQAACALAAYDPDNDYWENDEFVQFMANHLVRVAPSAFTPWRDSLRGVKADLVEPLGEIFRNEESGESVRRFVTDTLAEYLQDDPGNLTRLIVDADADAFQTLFPVLAAHRQVAIEELQGVLARTLNPDWKDPPVTSWPDVPTDAKAAIESAHGMIGEHFACCQTLPWEQFAKLSGKLNTAGYRPTRVRPYRDSMADMVAAIWIRDGGRFELETDLTGEQLPASGTPATKDGLVPVDFAVQSAEDPSETRFLVLWGEPATAGEQRRLLSDLNDEQLTAAQASLTDAGFASQATIAVWTDEAGQRHYGGIWSSHGAPSELNAACAGFELVDQPQWDVAVAPASKLADPLDRYRQSLSQFDKLPPGRLEELSETPQFRSDRARARFYLGQFEPALEDLGFLVALKPPSTTALSLRAWTLAALNKPEPSAESLSKYLELVGDASQRAHVEIVHAAWSGDHEGAFAQLDAATRAFSQSDIALYNIASAAALAANAPLGDGDSPASTYVDRAMALLASAITQGFTDGDHMGDDANLIALHSDARFSELLGQLNPPARYAAVWRTDAEFESRLVTASPQEMLVRVQEFVEQDYRPFGITIRPTMDVSPQASIVFHRPIIPDALKEQLAVQQATAATALLRLEETSRVWPLLTHRGDSRLRSYLLHRLVPYEAVAAAAVLEQLSIETEVSRQRALILAIGELTAAGRLTDEQRISATTDLAQRYADDPDAGIHGAAEWTLRQLGADQEIATVREAYASGQVVGNRQWYLTKEGKQTMVVLDAMEPFVMGSPLTEAERADGPTGGHESRHRRLIGRRFAIAAQEVTVAQFERFRSDHNFNRDYALESDAPANAISWYDAAAFCNWLSEVEKIPRDQWCYDPDQAFAEGMTLPADYLERTGYRLPTEAEWEYACRAGSTTARHYGETARLLGQYAWYTKNGDKWTPPVGSLKPNDTGLFDTLGNLREWCDDRAFYYEKDREYQGDPGGAGKLDNVNRRVLRGGSFLNIASYVRSAFRDSHQPLHGTANVGFRPARTFTPE